MFESTIYSIPRPVCKLYEELNSMRSGVIGIDGSGKQGKSSLAHAFAEQVPNFARRQKFMLEEGEIDTSMFPGYKVIQSLWDVVPDSVLVIEDLTRWFGSRGSGKEYDLPRFMALISHKNVIVIFTVQNLMDADLVFFRLQNWLDLRKLMYDEDLKFERPELRASQVVANIKIKEYAIKHPECDIRSLVYSVRYSEVSSWPLATFWKNECAFYLKDYRPSAKEGARCR